MPDTWIEINGVRHPVPVNYMVEISAQSITFRPVYTATSLSSFTMATSVNTLGRHIVTYSAENATGIVNQRERRIQRATAEDRATELLLAILDSDQRAAYERDQVFEVVGNLGGRYRIRPGSVANVDWLADNGDVAGRLCAHPSLDEWLPNPDIALGQLLALTTDERAFVETAIIHGGRRLTHISAA